MFHCRIRDQLIHLQDQDLPMSSIAASSDCSQCRFKYQANAPDSKASYIDGFLRSNECPSDSELAEVRRKVDMHTERLVTLDNMISDTQDTLELMQRERERVSVELSELKNVSHPVRRLSVDVLSDIFLACIEEDLPGRYDPFESDSLDTRRVPWILTRICSRWRGISALYPRLWSTICLNLDNFDRRSKQAQVGCMYLLGLHIQRSASHSLQISMKHIDTGEWLSHPSSFTAILSPLEICIDYISLVFI